MTSFSAHCTSPVPTSQFPIFPSYIPPTGYPRRDWSGCHWGFSADGLLAYRVPGFAATPLPRTPYSLWLWSA